MVLLAVAALLAAVIGIEGLRTRATTPTAQATATHDRQGAGTVAPVGGPAADPARRGSAGRLAQPRPRPFRLDRSGARHGEVRDALAQGPHWDAMATYRLSAFAFECRLLSDAVEREATHPSHVESVAATLALCDALPPRFREDPLAQLRSAAEAGVVEAQVAYPALASSELTQDALLREPYRAEQFKRDALRYLHRAASIGSVDALNELAHAYDAGVLTKRDPVAAYAYMDVVARTGLVPSAYRLLGMWGARLSAGELQAARTLAWRIHQQCCG